MERDLREVIDIKLHQTLNSSPSTQRSQAITFYSLFSAIFSNFLLFVSFIFDKY